MTSPKRHCLALDLKNDEQLINNYKKYHKKIWPEITKSIKGAGILDMQIYLFENRLFMIIGVDVTFSFEAKQKLDIENSKVQEWEKLMWKYQQALPTAKQGEKWMLMEQIFQLEK